MPVKPEYLLAHTDFVRVLAKNLIFDENQVDDVIQEAFLVALKNPPKSRNAVASWLTRVVNNLVISKNRRNIRREVRERLVAKKGEAPSTEEILHRETSRCKVVEAVLGLDNPYRDCIVLRYYENMPPRKIAEHLDLPVETVRTRLKRGHALLRGKLDSDFGGSRLEWCLALIPLAGLEFVPSSSAASSVLGKIAAMSLIMKIAASLLLLGGLFFVFNPFDASTETFPSKSSPGAPSIQNPGEHGARLDPEMESNVRDKSPIKMTLPSGLFLSGRVSDGASGAPIKNFEIVLNHLDLSSSRRQYKYEEEFWPVSHIEGEFSIPITRAGLYEVKVSTKTHMLYKKPGVLIQSGSSPNPLDIRLNLGKKAFGRVIDESGIPVEGVVIGPPANKFPRRLQTKRQLYGMAPRGLHCVSDPDGYFQLTGLTEDDDVIWALHDDYALNVVNLTSSRDDLRIVLNKGPCVHGTISQAIKDVVIIVNDRYVKVEKDGTFKTPPLLPDVKSNEGCVRFRLQSDFGPDMAQGIPKDQRLYNLLFHVSLNRGDVEFNLKDSDFSSQIAGTLYINGKPAPNKRITISGGGFSDPSIRNVKDFLPSDANGAFLSQPLCKGEYRINIPASKKYLHNTKVTLSQDGVTQKDIRIQCSEVSGSVFDADTQEAKHVRFDEFYLTDTNGKTIPGCFKSNAAGKFEFYDMPEGWYSLQSDQCRIKEVTSNTLSQGFLEKGQYKFRINKGQVADDLKVFTKSYSGYLLLDIEGFSKDHGDELLILNLQKAGASPMESMNSAWTLNHKERFMESIHIPTLEKGNQEYAIRITINNFCFASKIKILANAITKLELNKTDFAPNPNLVEVKGRLFRENETLYDQYHVEILPSFRTLKKAQGYLDKKVDPRGLFALRGYLPQEQLIARIYNKCELWLIPVNITRNSRNGCFLNIDLPCGVCSLSGELYDSETRQPLYNGGEQKNEIRITLKENKKNTTYSKYLWNDYRFCLEALAPGNYLAEIITNGYLKLSMEFKLEQNQNLNIGELFLIKK